MSINKFSNNQNLRAATGVVKGKEIENHIDCANEVAGADCTVFCLSVLYLKNNG